MSESTVISREVAECIRELGEQLEQGQPDEVMRLVDELTQLRERDLYIELGKLTRQFHEALNSFRLDARIADLAQQEIPDARERLNYVIAMTDDAANSTLSAVEDSQPLCNALEEQAQSLHGEWERFVRRELSAGEFRALSGRLSEFLRQGGEHAARIRNNLNEVLMAQDFQDLTGQIIKRVITLVEELEASLVNLIRLSGQKIARESEPEAAPAPQGTRPQGPPVPGVSDAGTVSGQDEVDDLLSSLGF